MPEAQSKKGEMEVPEKYFKKAKEGDVTLQPNRHGDEYIKPASPPTPPDEKKLKLAKLAKMGPSGVPIKGFPFMSDEHMEMLEEKEKMRE